MRLTHLCEYADKRKNKEPMTKIRNKLFELENIEDELGIDLITLFKALKNGVYVIKRNRKKEIDFVKNFEINLTFTELEFSLICDTLQFCWGYALKDYGKTWALTKEELL